MKKPNMRFLGIILGLFALPHVIYGVLCPLLSDIGFLPGATLGPYICAVPFLPLSLGWATPIPLLCGVLVGALFSAHRAGIVLAIVSLTLDYLLVLMNSFWFFHPCGRRRSPKHIGGKWGHRHSSKGNGVIHSSFKLTEVMGGCCI
jgi:hypothetical protein